MTNLIENAHSCKKHVFSCTVATMHVSVQVVGLGNGIYMAIFLVLSLRDHYMVKCLLIMCVFLIMIIDGAWKWPAKQFTIFSLLKNITVPELHDSKMDLVWWLTKTNHKARFFYKTSMA